MRIAITGIGIITALGNGLSANREGLIMGVPHVGSPHILPTIHSEWPVGEVPYTNSELAHITGEKSPEMTRNVLLGLAALKEALDDGGITEDIPFVNATTVGGMDITEKYYPQWRNAEWRHSQLFEQHEADFTTRQLALRCSLTPVATLSTACSSALNAIIYAVELLMTGQARQAVAGGTEALTRFHLNGFASLGILSERICRPFKDDRDGINLGEGAAYLVLEEEEHAKQRGAKIYAYLSGFGNRCDAYHQTASSPDGEGAREAMKVALTMAGIKAQDIAYINAHGTATVNNDASELCAIQHVFGDSTPLIESTKPLTGHTTSASGSIEAVFSILRMQQNGYRHVLTNAFGFGGNDSSLILSKEGRDLLPAASTIPTATEKVSVETDTDYKTYIPLLQARRMTEQMRCLVIAARRALEVSGKTIDGIVIGTRYGGMVPTAALLDQLTEEENGLSPALFMSSTHNAAAGTLALLLQCKGYNMTVVGCHPGETAQQTARLAICSGEAKNILVGEFDEKVPSLQPLLDAAGCDYQPAATAYILCSD